MDSISISRSNTESTVSGLISRIQTYIIDESEIDEKTIINTVELSAGDFIDALKEEVKQEVKMMNSVWELLIAVAEYIQSAAAAFSEVDDRYNTSKVER